MAPTLKHRDVNDRVLQCGYVARAHGLAGELCIKTHDKASTALFEVRQLELSREGGAPKRYEISAAREGKPGEALIMLRGLVTRPAAEALVGSTVSVLRSELPAPAEGEVFQGDLLGLEALGPDGERLGTVKAVLNHGPVPNLLIDDGSDDGLLVPFAEDFVIELDVQRGRLVLRKPELME